MEPIRYRFRFSLGPEYSVDEFVNEIGDCFDQLPDGFRIEKNVVVSALEMTEDDDLGLIRIEQKNCRLKRLEAVIPSKWVDQKTSSGDLTIELVCDVNNDTISVLFGPVQEALIGRLSPYVVNIQSRGLVLYEMENRDRIGRPDLRKTHASFASAMYFSSATLQQYFKKTPQEFLRAITPLVYEARQISEGVFYSVNLQELNSLDFSEFDKSMSSALGLK